MPLVSYLDITNTSQASSRSAPALRSSKCAVALAVLAALSSIADAKQGAPCKPQQAELSAVEAKYKPRYDEISSRGSALESEAPQDADKIAFNLKSEMKEQRWVLKLPSVTMKRNEIVVGIPHISMKTQAWSFDAPVVTMERRKILQKPEFTCRKDNWGIPYDCRTIWTNMYAHVPVTTMQRTEVKLDVPQTTWKDTRMSWDVPQMTWVENVWFVKVPEFTLINVAMDKGKDLQSKSEQLNKDIAHLNTARLDDTKGATAALYGCFRADLLVQKGAAEMQLEEGIRTLTSSIQSIRAQGADPTKLPSDGAAPVNLVASLAEMQEKKQGLINSFDSARALMDRAEKDALSKLQ